MASSSCSFARLALATTSLFVFALAQNTSPEDGGNPSPEDGGSGGGSSSGGGGSTSSGGVNNAGGASGTSPGSYNLPLGAEVAIIVVVALVALAGIASGILFYLAKKRGWEVRKTIRRASRRIVSTVNPRASARQSARPKGMIKMQDPPRTREQKGAAAGKDLEKGEGGAAKKTPVVLPMAVEDARPTKKEERRFKTVMPDSWTVGGKR